MFGSMLGRPGEVVHLHEGIGIGRLHDHVPVPHNETDADQRERGDHDFVPVVMDFSQWFNCTTPEFSVGSSLPLVDWLAAA